YFFFFSSRRRHTRFSRDWSSDVCSSDLDCCAHARGTTVNGVSWGVKSGRKYGEMRYPLQRQSPLAAGCGRAFGLVVGHFLSFIRSEERRVGKEGRARE